MVGRFLIEAEVKHGDGTISVLAIVNSKRYVYNLNSQYKLDEVKKMARRRKYGAAVNLLKNFQTFGGGK
jgi:hypothetical protein